MHVRRMERADFLELAKLWSVCFLGEIDMEQEKERAKNDTEPLAPAYGCLTDDGKLMAALVNHQFDMRFDGQWVKMSGVGGVATYPEHRRQGAVRALLAAALRDARADGALFSALYPFSHAFYRKFGYDLGMVLTEYEFSPKLLSAYKTDAHARLLDKDDEREYLRPVFERYASQFNLAITRNAKRLAGATASNPYAKNSYTYALCDGDDILSYVCFRKEDETLDVTEYAYASVKGLHAIFALLCDMSAQFSKLAISCPDTLPMHALVDAPYDVHTKHNVSYMVRALNCERVLSLMDKRGAAPFTVQVDDEFLPENSGTWRVTEDGAQKTDDAPDMRLSVQAFSQLAVGYTCFETASLRQDVTVFGNEETLARVFVKKPGFTGTHF